MQLRGLNELLALLISSRVPVLFITGSLALALLGNALYEVLTKAVGATPQALIGIVIGTLAILAFVVGWLQRFAYELRQRRRAGDQTIVPAEQLAEPHRGLILPVGLNPSGPEYEIIQWHLHGQTLRHCWLIVSPEVERSRKWSDLRQWLLDANVEAHTVRVADGNQADLGYAAALQAVAEARQKHDATPCIVDITSGLRAMVAGLVLACRDANVPVEYFASLHDPSGNPIGGSVLMKVAVRSSGEAA